MHKIISYIGCPLLILCFMLTGCGTQQSGKQKPSLTYAAFVQKLQQKGVVAMNTQALNADIFSGAAHGLTIQNEQITVFEYANSDTLQTEANRISSDGSTIHNQNGSTSAIDWIAPPHFFKADHILVFYIGKNQYITSLLQSILGPQFAGAALK